jgi:hypothetical protein
MPGGAVHTVHRDGRWVNEIEGQAGTVGEPFDRKADAVAAGRDVAQDLGVEHMIHNLDGQIHERNSYGHDPRNIPG